MDRWKGVNRQSLQYRCRDFYIAISFEDTVQNSRGSLDKWALRLRACLLQQFLKSIEPLQLSLVGWVNHGRAQ